MQSPILMIFAGIGAGAILFALTFVSLVIGGLVNAMIVLMAGPLVDRFVPARFLGESRSKV